jgi:hypothetical protein
MNESKLKVTAARLATIDELVENILPNFITPIPSRETLRDWFDHAHVPRFKSNPMAKRGGGAVYYSVAAVEKFLRTHTLKYRLSALASGTHADVSEDQ